jgi:hypothetical protein
MGVGVGERAAGLDDPLLRAARLPGRVALAGERPASTQEKPRIEGNDNVRMTTSLLQSVNHFVAQAEFNRG